jgi:hypothetical protein
MHKNCVKKLVDQFQGQAGVQLELYQFQQSMQALVQVIKSRA